jgi:4-hydroxy-3-polyprenylbenzoate decarboxylase
MPAAGKQRILAGIGGGGEAIHDTRMLRGLRPASIETHLILSRGAGMTVAWECDWSLRDVHSLADAHYGTWGASTAVSSDSFPTRGMGVAPCPVKSLGKVATGVCDNLPTCAQDVSLEERRRPLRLVRDTPLTLTRLRNGAAVTETGGSITRRYRRSISAPRRSMRSLTGPSDSYCTSPACPKGSRGHQESGGRPFNQNPAQRTASCSSDPSS